MGKLLLLIDSKEKLKTFFMQIFFHVFLQNMNFVHIWCVFVFVNVVQKRILYLALKNQNSQNL